MLRVERSLEMYMAASASVVILASCGAVGATHPHSAGAVAPVFPESVYPAPVSASTGVSATQDCPRPVGLVQHPPASLESFVPLVNGETEASSLPLLLQHYDPALWPSEASGWSGKPVFEAGQRFVATDLKAVPAWGAVGGLAAYLTSMCGHFTVAASWFVYYCSPGKVFARCDPGITTTSAVLERDGTWLTWYVSSGYQS